MAVPVMRWIGERIQQVEAIKAEGQSGTAPLLPQSVGKHPEAGEF